MSNLSLLVDCTKIIEWLEERKKVHKDWYNYVKAAEEKIKKLLKQSEQFSGYSQLQSYLEQNAESFCYFNVKKFVERLLKTDLAQQKSILFGYSNKRVKQWADLRKFMDSKNTGLLNNAKFMEQSLKFDLPGLNKNIETMDSQLGNIKRKIDFNQNTIFQEQKEKKKQIISVGLNFEEANQHLTRFNIEEQVPRIIAQVPARMQQIQEFFKANDLSKLVQIYQNKLQKDGVESNLQVLQYFIREGNDFYQVFRGLQPKENYSMEQKYRQFSAWQPVNEWDIQLQGKSYDKQAEELKFDCITMLQHRQTRQTLIQNLSQLLYYFKGLLFEAKDSSKSGKFMGGMQDSLTEKELDEVIKTLEEAIGKLNQKKLLTPLELKNNKKAYQHFVMKFHNIDKNIMLLQEQIQNYHIQIEQITQQRNVHVEKLRFLRQKVVQVKKEEETLLRELIGKEVKIVGQVNKFQ